MNRLRHINLEDTPWPISILKFNQAVSDLKPGDQMIAFLRDTDVMTNLQQLLRHQQGMTFTISTSEGVFCIDVRKARAPAGRRATAENRESPKSRLF